MSVKDQVIVITGAGKGIGRALAVGLAQKGAKLAICSRSEGDLNQLAKEIGQANVDAKAIDISDVKSVQSWIESVHQRFGRIDGLINNAGILGPRVLMADYPHADWQDVIRVNINGTFYVTQSVLRASMLGQQRGVIINISSGVARIGKPNWGAYAVSKFGCEGITQVLASELNAKGIRIFSLNPEGTRTGMRANAYPQEDPQTLKPPQDLLGAVEYLIERAPLEDSGKFFNWSDLKSK